MNLETKAPVFNPKYYELNNFDGYETQRPIEGNGSHYNTFPYNKYKDSNQEQENSGEKGNCMYEFNKPTYYTTEEGYKSKVRQSTEPLKYTFDFHPTAPCMIRTQQFQGLSRGGNKRPPASLVDVEDYLKKSALIVENNKAVAFDINKKTPSMPDLLNNRMTIPDCEKDYSFETTKTQRYELPQYNNPVYPKGHYQTEPMKAGRDTRQEVKDNYKKPENKYNIPVPKPKMPSLPSLPAVESAANTGKIPYYKEKYPCKSNYKYHQCTDSSCPTNISFFHNAKNKPQQYDNTYTLNSSCNQ